MPVFGRAGFVIGADSGVRGVDGVAGAYLVVDVVLRCSFDGGAGVDEETEVVGVEDANDDICRGCDIGTLAIDVSGFCVSRSVLGVDVGSMSTDACRLSGDLSEMSLGRRRGSVGVTGPLGVGATGVIGDDATALSCSLWSVVLGICMDRFARCSFVDDVVVLWRLPNAPGERYNEVTPAIILLSGSLATVNVAFMPLCDGADEVLFDSVDSGGREASIPLRALSTSEALIPVVGANSAEKRVFPLVCICLLNAPLDRRLLAPYFDISYVFDVRLLKRPSMP